MLRKISVLWGIKNTDSLDPLVNILVEALSGEIQKNQQEIISFEKRILEKIALLLTPTNLSSSFCSHAICHALPIESNYSIDSSSNFLIKKKLPGKDEGIEMNFTPIGNIDLIKGQVKYIITKNKAFGYDPLMQKSLISSFQASSIDTSTLWLGLKLDGIQSVERLNFYVDNNSTSQGPSLLPFRMASWRIGTRELTLDPGAYFSEVKQGIFDEFDPMYMMEKEILNFYQGNFITLRNIQLTERDLSILPSELLNDFNKGETVFNEPLVWIKIKADQALDESFLFNLTISINAFPVLNRSIIDKVHRFNGLANVVPLLTGPYEHYLAIDKISDATDTKYSQTPQKHDRERKIQSYSIRKGGMEKLDSRSSKEYIKHLLELIRDEYASFSGFGQETLTNLIKELNKIVVQIDQKLLADKNFNSEEIHYLTLERENNNTVFLSYWITHCHLANGIHPGSKFRSIQDNYFTSLNLLSSTIGGKGSLSSDRYVDSFKYAMLSNDKIVTAEDVKAFCKHELGDKIENVEIKKGFVLSEDPNEGIVRCSDVILTKKPNQIISEQEWQNEMAITNAKMKLRTGLNVKLRLILQD